MKLRHGLHLAYCTNIHRGESWGQTFDSVKTHTLAVRKRVCPDADYAIGLRLGHSAAVELSDPATFAGFQKWLADNHCYVFTINGFPYGKFHGARVKEQVYAPDWTTDERVEYTELLFDLLARLVPEGVEGSVSTVPVSFKEFMTTDRQEREARDRLWRCVEHIEKLSRETGRKLHLGLEPEPLCHLGTTAETVAFFGRMRADRPGDMRLEEHLGVNYDTCHLAVEFEEAGPALARLIQHRIKISKIHLSSALKVTPDLETRRALRAFADDTYFHQVIQRSPGAGLSRHRDLGVALDAAETSPPPLGSEWRIHFHIPLHCAPTPLYSTTVDHIEGTLETLRGNPRLCSHLEMETYTWEVMPQEMKNRSVVDQLAGEYGWVLGKLKEKGFY